MDRDAIRAYVMRDRAAVAALKRAHHAERYRTQGAAGGIALSRMLAEHARGVRPDWPTPRDRALDLAHHVALKSMIDRAAHAFPGR